MPDNLTLVLLSEDAWSHRPRIEASSLSPAFPTPFYDDGDGDGDGDDHDDPEFRDTDSECGQRGGRGRPKGRARARTGLFYEGSGETEYDGARHSLPPSSLLTSPLFTCSPLYTYRVVGKNSCMFELPLV